jgi:hypothetical protein
MQRTNRAVASFAVLAVCLLAGCGSDDGRQGASGSVTLDGEPLLKGILSFQPADGARANSAGGAVKDGKFDIPADMGLPPGKYRVFIKVFAETGRIIDDPLMGPTPEVKWVPINEAAGLEATVSAEGENHFEFKLTRANR